MLERGRGRYPKGAGGGLLGAHVGPLHFIGFSGPERGLPAQSSSLSTLRRVPLLWVSGLGGLVFSASCACLRVSGGASASHRAGRREQGPRSLYRSHSASHVRDHPQCLSSLNSNRWYFWRSGSAGEPSCARRAHPARRHAARFLTCVTFLYSPKRTMKRSLITFILQTRKQAQRNQYIRHRLSVG